MSIPALSHQYRTFDRVFTFKAKSDQLKLSVYNMGFQKIVQNTFAMNQLFSPPESDDNTQTYTLLPSRFCTASSLLNAYQHDFSTLLQLIDRENTYGIPPSPSNASCIEALKQAIVSYQPQVGDDNSNGIKLPICPITQEVFKDPVIDNHGHTFEKSAIEEWLQKQNTCPKNREPITALFPNREIRDLIEETQKNQSPVPSFLSFQKNDANLADSNLRHARECVALEDYEEALESYSKAFRYTKDWHHYQEVVDLYKKINEPEKALLSSFHLALYQVSDHQITKAIDTLLAFKGKEFLVDSLLIQIYQLKGEPQNAVRIALDGDSLDARLLKLVLQGDPYQFDLYFRLAEIIESPEEKSHILLKGVCHALEKQALKQAEALISRLYPTQPLLNQLIKLDVLRAKGDLPTLIIGLNDVAKELNQRNEARKVYKLLFTLDPKVEYYRAILGVAQEDHITHHAKLMCFMMSQLKETRSQLNALQEGVNAEAPPRTPALFLQKAENGDRDAQYNLGLCFEKGYGVVPNVQKAYDWYRKAADQGHAEARYRVAYGYENDFLPRKDQTNEAFRLNILAANQGNLEAQFSAGIFLECGYGTEEPDLTRAMQYYHLAAKRGHIGALFRLLDDTTLVKPNLYPAIFRAVDEHGQPHHLHALGKIYQEGRISIPKDEIEAVRYFRVAADLGLPEAMHSLAKCYLEGRGIKRDPKTAIQWLRLACEQNCVEALNTLGNCYERGINSGTFDEENWILERNQDEALNLYNLAKLQEQQSAQISAKKSELIENKVTSTNSDFEKGSKLHYGTYNIQQDMRGAIHYYQMAASANFAQAQYALGEIYLKGYTGDSRFGPPDIIDKDINLAVEWFRKAAAQGHLDAISQLISPDCSTIIGVVEAASWSLQHQKIIYKREFKNKDFLAPDQFSQHQHAAQLGIALAQFKLAECYRLGCGVATDMSKAVQLYRLAADQGEVDAQLRLGQSLQLGAGIEKDEKEAVRLYRNLSDKGHPEAQCLLGKCFQKGIGVEKDISEANRLFYAASNQGHLGAKVILTRQRLSGI